MRENDLLAWIAANTNRHDTVSIGIGDDMGAVTIPADAASTHATTALALLKIDQALDRVHFDLREHTPREVGRKAVNRCFSDCAAMACLPRALLISVAFPDSASMALAKEMFHGFQEAAGKFDCPIVGGDTAVWDQRMAITVAALGYTPGTAVRRSGAIVGDAICVTGQLGGSILGKHMSFTPRIIEAQKLQQVVRVHAMMDLSDGLAMDLPRMLAASAVGAIVDESLLPIHPDAQILSARDGQLAEYHALCDGEDYELLFSMDESEIFRLDDLRRELSITVIGNVTSEKDIILRQADGKLAPWPRGGWEYTEKVFHDL